MSAFVVFRQNPNLDLLFGFIGKEVPTKQDAYKPVLPISFIDENGFEVILEQLYQRRPNSETIRSFHKLIQESAARVMNGRHLFKKPALIEVVLSISINKKRFLEVDVDNLSKTVLDGLNGYVFEDDSQVVNLICQKNIHPLNINGILIGVTEIKETRKGILQDFWLLDRSNND